MMNLPDIYVDADACPVKEEVIRVAERHGVEVFMVSNSGLRLPQNPMIHSVAVGGAFDAADDWIAERAGADDIAITSDILLAQRCLNNHVIVINPNGKPFTDGNIGSAVAMRSLNSELRDMGLISGNNPSFAKQDRSRFLQALEKAVQDIKRRA